jgi:hypothetical protein
MALTDILPDRPLTREEFHNLQSKDVFDSVMTLDNPGTDIDILLLTVDGTEHQLHYTDEEGWHKERATKRPEKDAPDENISS